MAGCHLSKHPTHTHTHAQREVVYKYKMKFPSSARWPQPKGLCWFGSCDRSAATVSDSGSILNRADRSWSAGRNRNQMWDLAAKTGSSKKPEGRDGGRPAEAPSQPPNRTTFQGLGGFRWGQQSPREENQKIKKNMVRWREDRNHREREDHPSPTVDTLYRFVRRSVERMMWRQFNTRLNDNTTN